MWEFSRLWSVKHFEPQEMSANKGLLRAGNSLIGFLSESLVSDEKISYLSDSLMVAHFW